MMTRTAPSPGELTCVGKPDGSAESGGLRRGSGPACLQHRGQVVTGMVGGRPRGTLCSGMAGGAGLARLWAGGSVGGREASASAQEEKGEQRQELGGRSACKEEKAGSRRGVAEEGRRDGERKGPGQRAGEGRGRIQGRRDMETTGKTG